MSLRSHFQYLMLAAVFLLIGCAHDSKISVLVRDNQTHVPLEGATVTSSYLTYLSWRASPSIEVKTDQQGRATLAVGPYGQPILYCQSPGYRHAEVSVSSKYLYDSD